jgi:hypothetical protein
LDTSALNSNVPGVTPRNFELHYFKHAARFADPRNFRFSPWLRYFPALSSWISPWYMCVEKSQGFNPNFIVLPDKTYLLGYWQSYRYFSDVADQLVEELTPVIPLTAASSAIALQIASGVSVALHVRRGDYVSLAAAAALHGTLAPAYYEVAMAHVSESVGQARYFVFSDDADWCRTHLRLESNAVFVTHNTGADSWQDLMLMARCQHHIIANSSFSWWGAWLADQRRPAALNRLVVAPARWFAGQPGQDQSDRFPSHWVVLP